MTDGEAIVGPPQDREPWAPDPAGVITAQPAGAGGDADQPEASAVAGLVETAWHELVAQVADALAHLGPDQFLILEYHPAGTVEPYAQAGHELGGNHCELVSEEYLPLSQGPIDHVTIRRQGWTPPTRTPRTGGPGPSRPNRPLITWSTGSATDAAARTCPPTPGATAPSPAGAGVANPCPPRMSGRHDRIPTSTDRGRGSGGRLDGPCRLRDPSGPTPRRLP
jgi:hypothetical protein